MSEKLHLLCKGFRAKIRCNLSDISYLSEKQISILIITTSLVFFNYVFLKIMFPVMAVNNVSHI